MTVTAAYETSSKITYRVNHLGQAKSSILIQAELLAKAKSQAAKLHLSLGSLIEAALKDYLLRQAEQDKEKERLAKEAKQDEASTNC